jgi:deoxyribodipyrimidine photo-lyase
VVVTDDYPCFFLPRMVSAAGASLTVAVEAVDSNGLLPLRAFGTVFPTAYAFRRAVQKELGPHLAERPEPDPLAAHAAAPPITIPADIASRWPPAFHWLDAGGTIQALPIERRVRAVDIRGGSNAARERLREFLASDLATYGVERNHPDQDRSSRLSPYLHWGHISAHEVFDAVMAREGWIGDLPRKATGAKDGWWGVSAAAESFLDELVTWRELGFNFTSKRDDYDLYESLPAWARDSLDEHANDAREFLYDRDAFDAARTHDPLWNAAQRQLTSEGRIHSYLRMLWGKKILEWSASPREALDTMIELNNRYALDGRDPNSYSGIFWVLGRYDRPWHPERDVYGVIRYMSSDNTARKMRVRRYISYFGGGG